jgi:hypothetical protein
MPVCAFLSKSLLHAKSLYNVTILSIESGPIRKVFIKGRGADIFSEFPGRAL